MKTVGFSFCDFCGDYLNPQSGVIDLTGKVFCEKCATQNTQNEIEKKAEKKNEAE